MITLFASFPALVAQAQPVAAATEGEPNLLMLVLFIILCVALAVLAVIGLLFGLAVAGASGAAVVSGAAVTSALAAALKKSPSAGLKVFVLEIAAIGGGVIGALAGGVTAHFHELPWYSWNYTGLGALIGIGFATLSAWVALIVWGKIWQQSVAAWQRWQASRPPRQPRVKAAPLADRRPF